MPIALPAHNIAVAFHHTGGSVTGEMINTQAYQLTLVTDPVIQNFLDIASQAWADGPHSKHTGLYTYTHASAIYNDVTLGKVALDSTAGAGTGGAGGSASVPLNVACIVQKTTAFAGRKFRGRMFFGGFAFGSMDGTNPNILTDAAVAAMQAQFDEWKAATDATGAVSVLLHQEGGPTPTLITSFDVHPLVATMRKRIR